MLHFLAFVGILALGSLALIALACLLEILERVVKKTRRTWQYKRRFKKKPLAKCYCIDCVNYDDNKELCRYYSLHFRNDEFCSSSRPDMYKIPNVKED